MNEHVTPVEGVHDGRSEPVEATAEPTLAERYARTRERVAAAARRSGRRADDILLVAVTKYAEPEDIRELIRMGHRDFGENRVQQLAQRAGVIQEWAERQRILPETLRAHAASFGGGTGDDVIGLPTTLNADRPIRWHMIGHLQRNKVKPVLPLVSCIHSVDSLRLAEEIETHCEKLGRKMPVMLQVNASEESTKFGVAVGAAVHLAEQIDTMNGLQLVGLMTMAPLDADEKTIRQCFSRTREIFDEMKWHKIGGSSLKHLSMGMSNDFEYAIAEGATMVRIGSELFGGKPGGDHLEEEG